MSYLPDFDAAHAPARRSASTTGSSSPTRVNGSTPRAAGGKLGLGKGFTFDQDVVGAKVRLFGDAVYDQDSWLPQIAVGAQYKANNRGPCSGDRRAKRTSGVDFYVAGDASCSWRRACC